MEAVVKKIQLKINGLPKQVVAGPDLVLLDLLRNNLGLTGAKQSCDRKGQCGACTVIANGRAIRSCLTKVVDLDGAEIITVEGLGTPDNPHLIQEAFVLSGAIQCGFCTPGMIMASKALLDKNPNPSTDDIKRALRGKEIHNGSYRLLPPTEVLERLNEELLEANLSECRFVAATYAVLNTRTMVLELARGGTPYPILRRRDGRLDLLRPAGSVIGVLPGARYPSQQVQLAPGDSLVICSDGVENVTAPQISATALAETFSRAAAAVRAGTARERRRAAALVGAAACEDSGCFGAASSTTAVAEIADEPAGSGDDEVPGIERPSRRASRMAPDEAMLASAWCATLRDEGPQAALEQLTVRYDSLRRMGYPLDDLTVLTVQIQP